MLRPECATFSGEMDLTAAAVHPTTLHCWPLDTFPIEIASRIKRVTQKVGFSLFPDSPTARKHALLETPAPLSLQVRQAKRTDHETVIRNGWLWAVAGQIARTFQREVRGGDATAGQGAWTHRSFAQPYDNIQLADFRSSGNGICIEITNPGSCRTGWVRLR